MRASTGATEPPAPPGASALAAAGLVDVATLVPDARVELKYSTADNFLGRDVYGDLERCFLVPDAARKLAAAARGLRERAPDLALLLYDCARPRSVQRAMWAIVEGTAQAPYVADPSTPNGSVHNRGCAVDLTLAARDGGVALDMGTPFDFFGALAEPSQEIALLDRGELTSEALANRLLLREVMVRAGFRPLANEWWHFDCEPAAVARERYPLIE